MAWRVHDAQHWGVPQRRRRISVVADFGGDTAGEILFERKSVSRHPAESGTAWERLAGDAQDGVSYAVRIRGGCDGGGKGALVQEDKSGTLGTGNDQTIISGVDGYNGDLTGDVIRDCGEVAPSLQARMGTGGNKVPLTYQKTTGTLSPGAHAGSYNGQDAYNDMLVVSSEISPTLRAKGNDPYREGGETNGTLQAKSNGGISYNLQNTVRTGMIVRRLTPMECERLQGFSDGWTDIGEWRDSRGKMRKPSDSPRYKALGNSIALPFWDFLAKRISAQYLRPVTMGSLFDGIGGFPLVFERHNGKGTARWASEIEEFPIAVTKKWFGEE